QDIKKIISQYFGWMPKQPSLRRPITEEPIQMGERRVSVHLDANPQIIIGYHKPPLGTSDDYVFEVIESILSRGRTSRFYRTFVEQRGLAESVQADNGSPASRYPNLFAIFATPRHPHGSGEVEAAIHQMIEMLKVEPVTETELQKVKNQVLADFIRRQGSNEGLAGMLSYYQALLGDFHYMTKYMANINKVNADDIMRVAKTYFKKDNRTVAVIVKE
ncbi:MAG: insulinase family protein, partial [Syntrophales bacterium]|nr:insulinase family protein [Syntrophales bacterium]